ncbi:NlpC/P60 family protein [Streptomyces sp. NBC_00102]|uniref:C40 family peptidase n=1 Tax=Streptomyces sp. NBC_00102 TaxID=2975652 RepID=UPI002250DD4A|nr:NlpC/P60 family protein [Streptomyces sp. NBC_00102]MCX5399212.1 NlpC/P60 family protein [Streptomyces sp. NBC_00102]
MASHRKPRAPMRVTSPAVGFTTVALASVTLLSAQSATAAPSAPQPSIEEVRKKVDDLYRQAGSATQEYNRAKDSTADQQDKVDALLEEAAQRAEKVNEARRALGNYAAAQYRTGGLASSMTFFLADDPQSYFDQDQLMKRRSGQQEKAVSDFRTQQLAAAEKRTEATKSLEALTASQEDLRTSKQTVQNKLAEARTLLSKLTAEEKARLAELERKKEAEAKKKAEKLAAEQAAASKAAADKAAAEAAASGSDTATTGTGTSTGSTTAASSKGAKALAFAESQIGKPYVWGATGPASYDCSGLTQAAWREAGVDLPRTTWDQVNVGTRVATADLQPGDLIFFYDDISHVGIYKGDGMMVHAPKPGAYVREESIYYMPIYGSVRPG